MGMTSTSTTVPYADKDNTLTYISDPRVPCIYFDIKYNLGTLMGKYLECCPNRK